MHQKIVFREHGQTAVGGQAYPPWVRTCNGVPHTAMACMLPVCSTTPPSFSNYLTHTLLSQGCRAPVQEFFFCHRSRGCGGRKKKNSLPPHRRPQPQSCCHPGARCDAAVAQGPCGRVQEVPHSSSVPPCPHWRTEGRTCGGSPLCSNPHRRRGGGVLS